MKTSELLIAKPAEGLLKSMFQEDFACVKKQIAEALKQDKDKKKLFEIILCEHFKEIEKCEDIGLKIAALKNALMALEYLGSEAVDE